MENIKRTFIFGYVSSYFEQTGAEEQAEQVNVELFADWKVKKTIC